MRTTPDGKTLGAKPRSNEAVADGGGQGLGGAFEGEVYHRVENKPLGKGFNHKFGGGIKLFASQWADGEGGEAISEGELGG